MRLAAKERRAYWVAELSKLSGSFGVDASRMAEELRSELEREGHEALFDHLRLCGSMPEQYGHDSSAEKLYSKYTDVILSESLNAMGLHSTVITTRGDAADVQARAREFSLVADAKAFRLSRTAKNQKDFKVQAIDNWRGGLDYAIVVCPVFQLPSRVSQIYQQAIARNVCILSYCHFAVMVGLADRRGASLAEAALLDVLRSVSLLNPSKSAVDYWVAVNGALLRCLGDDADLWTREKTASMEGLLVVKEESLRYLRLELDRLLGLSHREALDELIRKSGLESRIEMVERIRHGSLLEL